MGEGAEVMVIEAGVQPRVLVPFTRDHDSVVSALRGMHARDLPNRLGEAIRTARSLVGQDPRAEIHVFTDGAHPESTQAQGEDVRVRWVGVGRRSNNVGITSSRHAGCRRILRRWSRNKPSRRRYCESAHHPANRPDAAPAVAPKAPRRAPARELALPYLFMHDLPFWVGALGLAAVVLFNLVRVNKDASLQLSTRISLYLVIALLVQAAIGIAQAKLGVPPLLVGAHMLGASIIASLLTFQWLSIRAK